MTVWVFVFWILSADGSVARGAQEYASHAECEAARAAMMPPPGAPLPSGTGVLTRACEPR